MPSKSGSPQAVRGGVHFDCAAATAAASAPATAAATSNAPMAATYRCISGPRELDHRFYVRRVWKQVESCRCGNGVAGVDQPPRVARQRGDVARHVDHSRRAESDGALERL